MAKFTYEIECLKCDSKKEYNVNSKDELLNKLREDGWKVKKKKKKTIYICVKHLYNRKNIKHLAMKLSAIIHKRARKLENLKSSDLWNLVPRIIDLKTYKKRDLKKIYKAMAILAHHDIHHPKLMDDINLELEMRAKTSKEKEKEKIARGKMKDEWRPRAVQVLEELRLSKSNLLPIIKNFSKEIYEKDYMKLSVPDCEKFAVRLLKEIGLEMKSKIKKEDKTK